MADPLSITASIIAILGAAEGVTKMVGKIKGIQDAPTELLALLNEVADLTLVLRHVQNFTRSQSARSPQSLQDQCQHLSALVDRAREKVLRLEELIEYKLVKPDSTPESIKISRLEWAKARRPLKEFQQSLRDIRQNISTHLLMIDS